MSEQGDSVDTDHASSSRRRPPTKADQLDADSVSAVHQKHLEDEEEEEGIVQDSGIHSMSSTSDDDEDNGNKQEPAGTITRKPTLSKSYTASEERQLLRKLDRRLTLLLCALYLLSFLDRSNIGNARVAGLQTSLGITGAQFDLTLTAFYVTYIAFEWMILLYRVCPPHVYIACCVFAWGLVACLQATVRNFTQLLVLRALLGITEAAFGPGVPFYMTFFYKREELAYRVGLQISAAPLATSFASSLAWVIVKLNESGPLESWRALFLFEGFPSLIAAVFAYHLIPDSPSTARWLTPRQRKVAALRLQDEEVSSTQASGFKSSLNRKSAKPSKLSTSDLVSTLLDPKSYLPALMFFSVNVSFASLPVFLPTIINDMSFSPLASQILAAPPYLVAFAFVLLISRASDRIPGSRGLFLMGCAGLSCISYATIAITGYLSAKHIIGDRLSIAIRYISVYGAAMGLFSSVVLIITWQLNNQQSSTGKGMAMTLLNVIGQCGPLIGVHLFPERDAPHFIKGMAVCSAFMAGIVVLSAGLRVWLGHLNGKLDRDGGGSGGARQAYEMVGMRPRGREGESEREEAEGLVSHGPTRRIEEVSEFRYML